MLLAIDVSNTTIKAGVFRGPTLVADWRVATERHKLADEYAMLLLSLFQASGVAASDITGVSISCVVPPLRAVFDLLACRYLHVAPLMVAPNVKSNIRLAIDNPREVGADLGLDAGESVLLVRRTLDFPGATAAVYVELLCRTDEFVFSQILEGDA